jgi:methanogenic corrinoid protein MtbC1
MSAMANHPGQNAAESTGSEADPAAGSGWSSVQSWQVDAVASGIAGHDARQALLQTLNAEIIPRLLRSHCPDPVDLPYVATPIDETTIERFVEHCIATDPLRHGQYFAALRDEGHELPELYLQLITPTARQLGRLWETDDCTFPEVTLGTFRLQSLIHGLAEEFCARPVYRQPQHRILLAPMPGSHHTLGFYMLSQFFRRDGWSVCSAIEADARALVAAARSDWYDVVALSVSCSNDVAAMRVLVHELRCASLNPRVGIMVGGPLYLDARVRDLLGAEAYSGDAREALRAADRLVRERERPN